MKNDIVLNLSNVVQRMKDEEEKKRKEEGQVKHIEWKKRNIILMLDIHRDFAKWCVFGNGEDIFNEEELKLISFEKYAYLMQKDDILNSYSEDIRVGDFAQVLSERYEYYGKDLRWNISIIDIEILFDTFRENGFIENDTSRKSFFAIFNPHLEVFENPVIWKDIKELVYFLDKCREWGIMENTKYQSLIENYKMFKTKNSKGNYLKSNSIRTTLSDLKDVNGILKTKKFEERAELIDSFIESFTL